jgi:hypothetical protein
MTIDEMIELALQHHQAEIDRDLEATMATIGPDPVWQFYPGDVTLRGTPAVRRYYQRLLLEPRPERTLELESVLASARSVALRFSIDITDESHVQAVGQFDFHDRLIVAERVFGLPEAAPVLAIAREVADAVA